MNRILLATAIFLSIFSSTTFSQENQPPFNYQKTIWIIHSVDGKGIVYGLSDYYEPKSAFIIVRNILTKYVYRSEDFPPSTSVKDLAPEYLLILMNDVTEQSLLIGDHWVSDGKKIAVMQEADFNKLKGILDLRKEIDQPPYSKHPTDSLIFSFRKAIKDNPEESEYRLKLYEEGESQQSLGAAKKLSSASATQLGASSTNASASSLSFKETIATPSQNQTNSLPKVAVEAPKETQETAVKDNESDFKFLTSVAGVLLVVCFLIWRLKRKKQ